jgi:hypothetical protein
MATVAECATHCFVSVTRLRDLIGGGQITHCRNGQYDLATVRREYIEYLQKAAQSRSGDAVGLSKQRVKLEAARTDAIEFKNAVARGEYVRLDIFAKVHETHLTVFRERCLIVPGACADELTPHTPADRTAIELVLREKVYEALDELSDPGWQEKAMARVDEQQARSGRRADDIEEIEAA